MNKSLPTAIQFIVLFLFAGLLKSQNFTWIKGPSTHGASGTHGTIGTPAPANTPGSRNGAVSWRDTSGNFWLFGGNGIDQNGNTGLVNDLWKYNKTTNQWTWISGDIVFLQLGKYGTKGVPSTTNCPGARESAVGWADGTGNLWLFGGYGYGATFQGFGYLNDLWKFNIATGTWTWMGGSDEVDQPATYGTLGTPSASNIPGGRKGSVAWKDGSGNMWLFGGMAIGSNTNTVGRFNDLWKYDGATNEWTWVNGGNTPDQNGIYGVKGSPGANNLPGSRAYSTGWFDQGGNLWLFGGDGFDKSTPANAYLNDLWKYSMAGNQWTWVSGADTIMKPGIYGTMGSASPLNIPGARKGAISWVDGVGNFWLFGGTGNGTLTTSGTLNDLWKYDKLTNRFVWLRGNTSVNIQGAYGTMGLPSGNNIPGGRMLSAHWIDSSNNLWLFGGLGHDGTGNFGNMSDLWTYKNCYINPLTINIISNDTILCIGETAILSAIGSNNFTWNNGPSSYSYAVTPTATAIYTVYTQDNTGCFYTTMFTQSVSTCMGMNEQPKENSVLIYPNPNNGNFIISNETARGLLKIINISGKVVYEAELQKPGTEVRSTLPVGLYFYEVTGNDFTNRKGKIVITGSE